MSYIKDIQALSLKNIITSYCMCCQTLFCRTKSGVKG